MACVGGCCGCCHWVAITLELPFFEFQYEKGFVNGFSHNASIECIKEESRVSTLRIIEYAY